MVFEALPGSGLEGGGSSDTVRGKIGEGSIIGLAVVHQDLALAADAEMLLGSLGGIGHRHEGNVGVGEGLGGFPVRGDS